MSRSVRISWKTALFLRALVVDKERTGDWRSGSQRCVDELRAAMAPKKFIRAARARKTTKRLVKKDETAAIREAVMKRANGACEHCGTPETNFRRLELDHFFGRVRVKQAVENCWALCHACHVAKTNNSPNALGWLISFRQHAVGHDYIKEVAAVIARIRGLELSWESAAVMR